MILLSTGPCSKTGQSLLNPLEFRAVQNITHHKQVRGLYTKRLIAEVVSASCKAEYTSAEYELNTLKYIKKSLKVTYNTPTVIFLS